MHEAVRLFLEVVGQLHAVKANDAGVLFALAASPQLADDLAAFGAGIEDDEADGSSEPDARLSPLALEHLLAPAPRQGRPVPEWSPPAVAPAQPKVATLDLYRRWPEFALYASDAA